METNYWDGFLLLNFHPGGTEEAGYFYLWFAITCRLIKSIGISVLSGAGLMPHILNHGRLSLRRWVILIFHPPFSLHPLTDRRIYSVTPFIFFIPIWLSTLSCTPHEHYSPKLIDFSKFQDRPLTAEIRKWLKSGEQSRITPRITGVASRISGLNRRERLVNALDFIENNFKYDNWYNDKVFSRTADQLFQNRILGGCSDYGLAMATLFRALEIPAKLVLTANVDWMIAFQKNNPLLSTGHVFIEVYLEDRWFLADSAYRLIFDDYNTKKPSYPRQEYFCARGRDYWELGITDISKLDLLFRECALSFKKEFYSDPQYPKIISIRLAF